MHKLKSKFRKETENLSDEDIAFLSGGLPAPKSNNGAIWLGVAILVVIALIVVIESFRP